jgi:hypothetical protein
MNIKEELLEKSQNTNGEIFNFSFNSKALNYKSLLKGFNKEIFDLFDLTYKDLDIDQGIKDLFHGGEINVTEKQSLFIMYIVIYFQKTLIIFSQKSYYKTAEIQSRIALSSGLSF